MAQLFRVQGFSHTASRTVEVCVWAESRDDAARQLRACGLRFVTVADWTITPDPAATLEDAKGPRGRAGGV